MAARTIRRGAWIAPANEPLENVVALENGLAEDRWLDLLNAQVNVSRQDPHGFLWMSADTLSEDPDLRPINVRRLLILLRRLALQRGANYVFEPNSDTFERVVKYSFESLLGDMFDRGAFAGATQSSSFRVITESPVNTPQSRDQGMFLVEIQVAPSQPMAFLTVRLTQTTDRAVVTEVA
jgi:phage tail sheath protein FI